MSLAELEQHDVFSEVDEQIVELLYEALDNADVTDEDVQRITRRPADTASGSPGSPMITTSSRPRARCVPCCGNASPLWSPSLRRKVDSRLIPIRSTKWTAVTGASCGVEIGSPSRDRDIRGQSGTGVLQVPVRAWRRMAAAGRQDGQLGDCGYTLPNRVLCAQCEDGDGCA